VDLLTELVAATHEVQRVPYAWPGGPTADDVRRDGRGTCAAKHALLRERLEALGFRVSRLMVVGPLAPSVWPDLEAASGGLLEVHECLTVETEWAGPLLVDVTWHPAAIRAGLRGTLDWAGDADMACAVEPVACYAVADDAFRAQKELLRSRLYSPQDREVRDRVLAEIAARAGDLIRD
jgi:hypothetical protein